EVISLNCLHKSVDHKTLCLSFFTRPLLGIPQRHCWLSDVIRQLKILKRISVLFSLTDQNWILVTAQLNEK
ncbi:hypothetical protein, partial [Erwinia tasmaniensis]|uniref:hypothetical protein n=1 Tax=Erwinia tasmaniensis TaxID=338565 RepID=UPI003A4E1D65